MTCKFHAFMTEVSLPLVLRRLCGALMIASLAAPAFAERADRLKPLTIQADQQGQIDLDKQVIVFTGNVVVSKGTMTIRAGSIEVRQTPSGYDTAVAYGTPEKPATFRQKRDGVDEYMEGEASRLEYDGKAEVVKFINNAAVRRLRGANVADEITGDLVTYDSGSDVLRVTGGAPNSTTNPGGRVRAVLTPRQGSEAAVEAAAAAAAAASAPLRLSPSLDAATPGAAR